MPQLGPSPVQIAGKSGLCMLVLGLLVGPTTFGVLSGGCMTYTSGPSSSSTVEPNDGQAETVPTVCVPGTCAAGNECIADATGSACRRACTAQSGSTGCAFNWTCKSPPGAEKPFCVKDSLAYEKKPGQWGTPCNPRDGFDQNPACDSAQSFWCYATSPTDGSAFCTQYQCTNDSECRGGFSCVTINKAPNALSARASRGETTTACLPRSYCSTCEADVDCPSLPNGIPQVCVADTTGRGKFCTSACQKDSNCRLDSKCESRESAGGLVCVPRAGTCKGDGSLCSPCHSDAECPDGYCLSAPYSNERYCSVKSKTGCTVGSDGRLKADCPKPGSEAPYKVGCSPEEDPDLPKDQCFGIIDFGGQSAPGCWTKSR